MDAWMQVVSMYNVQRRTNERTHSTPSHHHVTIYVKMFSLLSMSLNVLVPDASSVEVICSGFVANGGVLKR